MAKGQRHPHLATRAFGRAAERGRRRGAALLRTLALVAGTTLFGILGLALGWLTLDPLLTIRAVDVEIAGPGALTVEEVRAALDVEPGGSFARLDRPATRARVAALPRVRSAELGYRWFHRLRIAVTERGAVALVLTPGGRALEVSGDGILLAPRGRSLADLPLLSWDGGPPASSLSAGERLDLAGAPDLLALLADLQRTYPDLWAAVSEAHLREGGDYELYCNDTPTVVWARGQLSDLRCRAWAGVMSDLERRDESDAVVDLRFQEQILVRFPADGAPPAGAVSGRRG